MEELDAFDREEERKLSKDEIRHKLDVCKERRERYGRYRDMLENSGERQLSLTDPDARLMKANEEFCVGYNVQTAVDAGSHMIAGFMVTNRPTTDCLPVWPAEVKKDYGERILETTADKGYECLEDHAEALAAGIIPNVIQRDGSGHEVVEFEHQASDITGIQKSCGSPDSLKACLQAEIVPDAYQSILTDAEITEVRRRVLPASDSGVLRMNPEETRRKALEGFFFRDAERNLAYCPQGEILRQKSVKRNGNIRYCNRLACKKCRHKCTTSKFKEADFPKDVLIRPGDGRRKQNAGGKECKPEQSKTTSAKKTVRYVLHLDRNKMENRKCLSEHPFGTIKRALGQYYFLLKGFAKVKAEMGLFCLSYNLRRADTHRSTPIMGV